MGSKNYFKRKPIKLFDQMIALKAAWPDAACKIKGNTVWWSGRIQPSPLSKTYPVVMTFRLWKTPAVWVMGDELERLEDPDFPHKFRVDKDKKMVKLCLYRYREFSSYKLLSKTIIPWVIEWLYFYEVWLATGEWCGGGEHPAQGEEKEANDEDT